jgi:hypothetical protein
METNRTCYNDSDSRINVKHLSTIGMGESPDYGRSQGAGRVGSLLRSAVAFSVTKYGGIYRLYHPGSIDYKTGFGEAILRPFFGWTTLFALAPKPERPRRGRVFRCGAGGGEKDRFLWSQYAAGHHSHAEVRLQPRGGSCHAISTLCWIANRSAYCDNHELLSVDATYDRGSRSFATRFAKSLKSSAQTHCPHSTYNQRDKTLACLYLLCWLGTTSLFGVLVWDNGSQDETLAAIRKTFPVS